MDISEYKRTVNGIRGCVRYMATGAIFQVGRAEATLRRSSLNSRRGGRTCRYWFVQNTNERNKVLHTICCCWSRVSGEEGGRGCNVNFHQITQESYELVDIS